MQTKTLAEAKANNRLAIAAPDLVASLKELRSIVDYDRRYERHRMSAEQAAGVDAAFDRSSAILTRTEGKTP